jgi:hypothetical protein
MKGEMCANCFVLKRDLLDTESSRHSVDANRFDTEVEIVKRLVGRKAHKKQCSGQEAKKKLGEAR